MNETTDSRGRSVLLPSRTTRTAVDAFTIDPTDADYLANLRGVLSLAGDTSFDSLISELARTAHNMVEGVVGRDLGPVSVVDYYTDRVRRLRLSDEPRSDMPLVLTYYSGDDSNLGAAVLQTFDTDDLTGATRLTNGESYWYDTAGRTLYWQGNHVPDDSLSVGHEFPVQAAYTSPGIDTDPIVRAAIENLVLALFSERHGGGSGEARVGAVMNGVRLMLRPLVKAGL